MSAFQKLAGLATAITQRSINGLAGDAWPMPAA